MIDLKLLQTFCSTDLTRPNLQQPFTINGDTYATDGRIVIKVPAVEGVQAATKWHPVEQLLIFFLKTSKIQATGRLHHCLIATVSGVRDEERHG